MFTLCKIRVRCGAGVKFRLELGLGLKLGLVDIARHLAHRVHVLFSRTHKSAVR